MTNDDMKSRNLSTQGNNLVFKIGNVNYSSESGRGSEMGIYSSQKNYRADLTHDNQSAELTSSANSFGVFYTVYALSFYAELGYGKVDLKTNFKGDISADQKVALRRIYSFEEETISDTELRFLVGYKMFKIGKSIISISLERVIFQETSVIDTNAGIETKILF